MPKKKLLDYLPPPLLTDLAAGRCLPIIGAGLSRNAVVPPGEQAPPDWAGLGRAIGTDLPIEHAADSAIEAISVYEHTFGRAKLVDRVAQILQVGRATPGIVHRAFCALPFDAVVTTNIEHLLDTGYRNRHGAVLAVTEEQQLRLANPYDGPVLVKLHGDLHQPSTLVLTEQDYDEFALRRPLFVTWLAHQLITKTGLFIGYSLEDADFRQVLAQLRSRLGDVPPDLYVLTVGCSPATEARYRRRGVRVINLPPNKGHGVLAELFAEIDEHWRATVVARLTGTTAAVRALLRAGRRVPNAVLFLVPEPMLSVYDEFVFPTLVKGGLIPVTRQDVAYAQRMRVASLEALLSIAGIVVVHTESPDEPLLTKAAAEVGSDRTLSVGVESPIVTHAVPLAPDGDWEAWGQSVASAVLHQAESYGEVVPATFEALYQTRQFREAIILGVVELESELRRRVEAPGRAPTTLRDLLNAAREQVGLEFENIGLRELIYIRNVLVHGVQPVDEPQLIRSASVVRDLLRQLAGR